VSVVRSGIQHCPASRCYASQGFAGFAEFASAHAAFNIQHSTFNIQHSTFNIQHSTFNIQVKRKLEGDIVADGGHKDQEGTSEGS
jgi:hypothetical protein